MESISISIHKVDDDNMPVKEVRITIKDEEIIEQILADFTGLELKKDNNAAWRIRDYEIRFLTTNMIKDQYLLTDYFTIFVDQDYLDDFEIVNEWDHLKTVKS